MSWDWVDLLHTGWIRAVLLLVVGLAFIRFGSSVARRRLVSAGNPPLGLLIERLVTTVGAAMVVLSAAQEAGLDLSAVLATAGVVTLAIGFAAQTSLSNLISGLFLLFDRPFQIGDAVEIDGRVGVVDAVTLLSTYLRTYDNVRIRWPNEVVLKATILNYSRYPARRLDMRVRLRHGGDVGRAVIALREAVRALPEVLIEPAAEVALRGYVDSGVEVELRAWVDAREVVAGRTAITLAVHDTLTAEKIAVADPFPAHA